MEQLEKQDLEFVGQCFLKDIDIENRISQINNNESDVSRLLRIFNSFSNDVVYTAFDGDHFHLLQNMRKFVFNKGYYPANPESILGYKNTVLRYQSKFGVLLDDLSILQNCDKLWVFTDCETTISGLSRLPEGVLIEIAFFLKRRHSVDISFISLKSLLTEHNTELQPLSVTYEEVEELLINSQRKEIIDIANNNFKIDKELKSLVYFITDPLDYKYAEWLRDGTMNNSDEIALVPGLATRISDAEVGLESIGKIILSWSVLLDRISKKRAYYLDNTDIRRSNSIIVEALKKYCIQIKGPNYLKCKKWKDYSIPKLLQKEKWPITQYESKQINYE